MTRTNQQERKLIGLEIYTVVITTHTTLRAAAVAAVPDILDSQCIQFTPAQPSSAVFLCCSHFVNALAVLMVPAVLGVLRRHQDEDHASLHPVGCAGGGRVCICHKPPKMRECELRGSDMPAR